MQFYILMVDYGRRGLEAVVKPEMTRREIVEEYRATDRPLFVKFVDGNFICDITDEIMNEAEAEGEIRQEYTSAIRELNAIDHARKLRAEAM